MKHDIGHVESLDEAGRAATFDQGGDVKGKLDPVQAVREVDDLVGWGSFGGDEGLTADVESGESEDVRAIAAGQRIGAAACKRVVSEVAAQQIVLLAALQHVIALPAVQIVLAEAAEMVAMK